MNVLIRDQRGSDLQLPHLRFFGQLPLQSFGHFDCAAEESSPRPDGFPNSTKMTELAAHMQITVRRQINTLLPETALTPVLYLDQLSKAHTAPCGLRIVVVVARVSWDDRPDVRGGQTKQEQVSGIAFVEAVSSRIVNQPPSTCRRQRKTCRTCSVHEHGSTAKYISLTSWATGPSVGNEGDRSI